MLAFIEKLLTSTVTSKSQFFEPVPSNTKSSTLPTKVGAMPPTQLPASEMLLVAPKPFQVNVLDIVTKLLISLTIHSSKPTLYSINSSM